MRAPRARWQQFTITYVLMLLLIGVLAAGADAAVVGNVQSGTAVSNGNGTVSVSIASVDPSRSFLIFQTRHDNNRPPGSMVRGRILNSTTLEFARYTDETGAIDIQWYVVEFESGVSVRRGELIQSGTSVSATISPALNSVDQAFVTWSKTPNNVDNSYGSDDAIVGDIISTSSVEFRFNSAGTNQTIWWQVVEFTDPADINVQRGSTSLVGTATSTNVTLSSGVDLSSSFALIGYRSNGDGADIGERLMRARLTATNTLTIDRSTIGSNQAIDEITWQVIELTDGSTVQSGNLNLSSGVSQTTIPISSVDLNRTIAFASGQPSSGQCMGRTPYTGDDVIGVAAATFDVTSSTQITAQRSSTAAATDITWYAVEFNGDTTTPPPTGQVSRVGNWTTGLTHTVGSGTDRLLVFAYAYENGAGPRTVNGVTYGGVSLTLAQSDVSGSSGFVGYSSLWYLDEAGIQAASGNTFSVSLSGGGSSYSPGYAAAVYEGVDQSSPLLDVGSNATASSSPNPLTIPLSVEDGAMSVGNYQCGNTGSYTWNNGWSEVLDQSISSATMGTGENPETATGTSTASATHSGPNRQAAAAIALRPATVANQAPALASIGSQNVDEGANLNFGVSASDPDGDSLILSAENVPTNATFTDNFDGTGTFDYTPDFTQAGVYNVTFIVSDGALADTEIVAITVNDVNRAPVLASIGAQSVDEGQNLNFGTSGSDADSDSLILSAENIPANATFTDNFDGTGTFDFTPDFTQAGVYNV
ncbi:MAG: hypothetical protein GF341_08525, partial [candidate division Zixibacteria bacterium]|nr:hypothetical protein [candidate division Zixibacteria bacterium]